MRPTTSLRGLSWDHGRAFPPIVAAAQRYEETHPGVRIVWEKHSLHDFGHAPLDVLCQSFDLLIIDHPWMGFAHATSCLLGLRPRIGNATFADLQANCVGGSFASYCWADDLWALPIDAACPAAFWRADRTRLHGAIPATWKELIEWAAAGRVLAPGFGPDLLLHLLALCATEDESCGSSAECFAPDTLALEGLQRLRELFSHLPVEVFRLNPIGVHERLSAVEGDGPDYCPFAYSYNNYARAGYGAHRLTFGDPPASPSGKALRTVLGGTGLAVSAKCTEPDTAVDFACFAASANVQRYLYVHAGGQPAHVEAWTDPFNDQLTGGFFKDTRAAMQRAWTRPRFNGFPKFQELAGPIVQDWIQSGGSVRNCLDTLNRLWRQSHMLTSFPFCRRDQTLTTPHVGLQPLA